MKSSLLALLVSASLVAPTFAGDYYVVVPVKGRTSPVQVTLNTQTLVDAYVGAPYSHDFRPALVITGDTNYNPAGVVWQGTGLPAGLTLSDAGVLSGSPTQAAAAATFQLTANYKTKSGSQSYTLKVIQGTPTAAFSGSSYFPSDILNGAELGPSTKTVTLYNQGNSGLTISGISLTGAQAASYSVSHTCPSVLEPGKNCLMYVDFLGRVAGNYGAEIAVATTELGVRKFSLSMRVAPFVLNGTTSVAGTVNGRVGIQSNGVMYGGVPTTLTPVILGKLFDANGEVAVSSAISGQSSTMTGYVNYVWRSFTFPQMPAAGSYTLKVYDASGNVLGKVPVTVPAAP